MTRPQTPPPNPNRKQPEKNSLMRNLGEFFGHVAHGIKSDPNAPPPQQSNAQPVPPSPPLPEGRIVRQEIHEQEVLTPEGKIVLRRTIIDEVERPPK